MTRSENLYRRLLKLYPARYRRQYEDAMAQCFRDQLRTANTAAKRLGLWLRIFADLALTVPAQRVGSLRHRPARGGFGEYSEPARRAIFFARSEAVSFSGDGIAPRHLLLGLLRGDPELASAVLGRDGVPDLVRAIESMEASPRLHPSRRSGLDIPLTDESKRVLAVAFDRAKASGCKVSSRHLMAAIIKRPCDASRLLRERARDLSVLSQTDPR